MASVYIDPDQVDDFAALMLAMSRDIETQVRGVRGDFVRLGDSWRDAEYFRFAQEIQAAEQTMRRYLEELENYVNFLKQKAADARAMQDIR